MKEREEFFQVDAESAGRIDYCANADRKFLQTHSYRKCWNRRLYIRNV